MENGVLNLKGALTCHSFCYPELEPKLKTSSCSAEQKFQNTSAQKQATTSLQHWENSFSKTKETKQAFVSKLFCQNALEIDTFLQNISASAEKELLENYFSKDTTPLTSLWDANGHIQNSHSRGSKVAAPPPSPHWSNIIVWVLCASPTRSHTADVREQ